MAGSGSVNSDARRLGGVREVLLVGAALIPLGVAYVRTIAPDLGIIDSGELAVVCARLGIAHPTGYPLYTLLGRIAVLLFPSDPIAVLNAVSATASWVAAFCTILLARQLLRPVQPVGWLSWFLPVAAGYWVGANRILWEQAIGNEVYSLHVALVSFLLLALVQQIGNGERLRRWLLVSYLVGLGAAHHLSIVFVLPACALVLLWSRKRLAVKVGGLPLLAWMGLLGVIAWSANLYLPIRSAENPLLDWGDPTTWHSFWRHHSAVQYRVWQFQSIESWGGHALTYLRELPARVTWPGVLFGLAAPFFRRGNERRLVVLGLVWVSTIAWASGYDIHDLAPYYLSADLAWVALAVVGAAGAVRALVTVLHRQARARIAQRILPIAIPVLLVFSAVDPLLRNGRAVDRSGDHFIRTYATGVLQSLPQNAVVLSSFWDAVVSPALYLQQIEGLRPDVTIIDVELLRRSWYFPQLRRTFPGFLDPLESEIETFSEQLALFERNRPYDPAVIERAYREVIDGIARSHWPDRPAILTPDQPPNLIPGMVAVPEGLFWTLYEDPTQSPQLVPPDFDRLLSSGYRPNDRIHRLVLDQWRIMAAQRAGYLEKFGRPEEAVPWKELFRRVEQRLLDDGFVILSPQAAR